MLWLYDWWTRVLHGEVQAVETDVAQRGLVKNRGVTTVGIHQMHAGDYNQLAAIRHMNAQWLGPWDASAPEGYPTDIPDVRGLAWMYAKDIRHDRGLPLMVSVNDQPVGHITVMSLQRAASHSAQLGYWISEDYANNGVMTLAVAMAIDACFYQLRLHRVEINIRPENVRSIRLVEKLGLRYEGLRERFLHVGGQWCDHNSYAITAEEYPHGGLVTRLENTKM